MTLGQAGAIAGNAAALFDGGDDVVYSNAQFSNPTVFSRGGVVQDQHHLGGKIIGFGNNQNGDSNS